MDSRHRDRENSMQFFLGTHMPQWLERIAIPMFISHLRLKDRRKFPRALGKWSLDSGGFSELSLRGKWTVAPRDYIMAIRRYQDYIGNLQWAAAQDWMCEPFIVTRTGLSVREHQWRTVTNYLELMGRAPDLPIVPVLQGYTMDDYMRCRDVYDRCGVDLALPLVGLGSVCRRQHTKEIQQIAKTLSMEGIKLHGFGIKLRGRDLLQDFLVSSDSMAWSFAARRAPPMPGHTAHINCANCMEYAVNWYWRVVANEQQESD